MSTSPFRRRGVEPIGGGADEAGSSDWDGFTANEFMHLEINKLIDKGMARDKAVTKVFASHPGLREAVVDEANNR